MTHPIVKISADLDYKEFSLLLILAIYIALTIFFSSSALEISGAAQPKVPFSPLVTDISPPPPLGILLLKPKSDILAVTFQQSASSGSQNIKMLWGFKSR